MVVNDVTPPVISYTPANISVTANNASCTAIVTWSEPTASDNCSSILTVEKSHVSGQAFPVGTTLVTYTFRDAKGNSSDCSFNITVSNSLEVTGVVDHVTCNGLSNGDVILTVFGGQTPYNFSWSNGMGTTKDLININGGLYTVLVTDAYGCNVTQSYTVNEPSPINVDVLVEGNRLTALNINADAYQWIRVDLGNAIIPSATLPEYEAVTGGVYAVIISKGACFNVSDEFEVVLSGNGHHRDNSSLAVYPNPNRGRFIFNFGREVTKALVRITDLNGHMISEMSNISGSSVKMDISTASSGIYILELFENNKVERIKMLKH